MCKLNKCTQHSESRHKGYGTKVIWAVNLQVGVRTSSLEDETSRKRAEIVDMIEKILGDGEPHITRDVIEEVFVKTGRRRYVQNTLETNDRFILVSPRKNPLDSTYALKKSTVGPKQSKTSHPHKAVPHAAPTPVNKPAQPPLKPDYFEKWSSDPFALLGRGETLVVDVANLLGRRCGGMLHEGRACPNPAALWPILKLLAQSKATKIKAVFFADASTRHHVQGKEGFESLAEAGAIREVPASYTADSKLLSWANENHGVVLTDDYKMRSQYADLYPWVNDPTRFIGHMVDDSAAHTMSYVRKVEPTHRR
jgi:hypothetical protein